jgi:hypothetical protein
MRGEIAKPLQIQHRAESSIFPAVILGGVRSREAAAVDHTSVKKIPCSGQTTPPRLRKKNRVGYGTVDDSFA